MALVGCFAAVDWIRAAAAVLVGVDRLLLLLALLVFALVIPVASAAAARAAGRSP